MPPAREPVSESRPLSSSRSLEDGSKFSFDIPDFLETDIFLSELNLESSEVDYFTQDDRKLIETLAYHVAFAIERIRLQEIKKNTYCH